MATRKHSSARTTFGQFMRGYIDAALWSSTGDDGRPLDEDYRASDIAPSSVKSMKRECARFVRQNRRDLASYCEHIIRHDDSSSCMAFAGHDFWLTRNGHGCGYWDRDGVGDSGMPAGPPGLGQRLTDAAQDFGSSDVYVGDDGLVYVSPEDRIVLTRSRL